MLSRRSHAVVAGATRWLVLAALLLMLATILGRLGLLPVIVGGA